MDLYINLLPSRKQYIYSNFVKSIILGIIVNKGDNKGVREGSKGQLKLISGIKL